MPTQRNSFQAPRGTADRLPEAQPYWDHVQSSLAEVARVHGYRRIDTPVFEDAGLFLRTVGKATDIVQKEMYTFEDRGGQLLSLRPEGTAGICRAYLEHGLHNLPQPVRLYYDCPMFRYDRPQAGRYRQFHQFGVEAIGDADAAVDLEVIQLAMSAFEALGLTNLTLVLNNIGDAADRPAYLGALQDYYRPHLGKLCHDCQRRAEHNTLRLLDCKQASCQPFLDGAPRSADYLGPEAKTHWQELLTHLDAVGIVYRLDHRLVRGLDYYTRTVFEIQPTEESAQSAVCAGGRYDGLIEQLGGRPTPGIGFAAGIERLVLNLQRLGVQVPGPDRGPIVIAFRGPEAKAMGIKLAADLRVNGATAVLAPERSLKAQLRYASSLDAPQVLVLGERELSQGIVILRDMSAGAQRELPVADAVQALTNG